jgi:rsbT co-antagonist protein RsbR
MSTPLPPESIDIELPLSQEALEAMPFPLALYTCDGLYVGANALIEQLFKIPRAMMIGNFNILTDPNSQDQQLHAAFRVACDGQTEQTPPAYYDFSFPGTSTTDRTGCWLETTYIPFRNATGTITHIGMSFKDVSAQVAAQREVALLRSLINNANESISATDLEGRFIFANQASMALSGYGQEIMDQSIATLYPDQLAQTEVVTTAVIEHGHWQGMLTQRHADGSKFPADISAFLLRDPQGQPTGIGAITRDISIQQAQEQRLRMFETLVELAPDGISVFGIDTLLTYANRAQHELSGYDNTLIGMPWQTLYPADLHAKMQMASQEIFAKGYWQSELEQVDYAGRRFPVQASIFLLRDEHNAPTGVASIVRDITAQRAQEQQLQIFKALFEHAPDAVGISGVDGRITYANAAQRDLYGYGDETIGLDWRTLYPADLAAELDAMGQLMWTNGFWRGTLEQHNKQGRRFPVQISAFMLRDAQGEPYAYASMIRDLTEQQLAEQERLNLQQQVIDAQQAALRELSTPLIPITDGVVAMPLIGSIDSNRAQQVIESLLEGVASLRAHTTIIDITGVPVVDTQVANALIRAAQAVKLLGAKVILTGIRPEVAQTLVSLNVDLAGIATRGTLQSGIAEALVQYVNPAIRRG